MGAKSSSAAAAYVYEDVQCEQGAAKAIADGKKGPPKRYMSSEELVEALVAMSETGDLAPEGGPDKTVGKRRCRATIHTELIETVLLMEDDDDEEDEGDQSEEEEEEKELKRSRDRKGTGFVTKEQAAAATRPVVNFGDDEDDDAVEVKEPRKRCRRGTGFVTKEQALAVKKSLSDGDDSDDDDEADTGAAAKRVGFEVQEDEGNDDLKERKTKTRRGTAFVTKKEAAKEDEADDEDHDDVPQRSTKGRRGTAAVSKEDAAKATRQVTFDEEEVDEDSDHHQVQRPRSRSRRGTGFVTKEQAAAATRQVDFREEEEEEDDDASQARSAKCRRGTAYVTTAQVAAAQQKLRSSGSSFSLASAEEASTPAGARVGARKGTGFVTKEKLLELLEEDGDSSEPEHPESEAKPVKRASLKKALSALQDKPKAESAKDASATGPALARNAAAAAAAGISSTAPCQTTRSVETVKQGCGCQPPLFRKVFGKPR